MSLYGEHCEQSWPETKSTFRVLLTIGTWLAGARNPLYLGAGIHLCLCMENIVSRVGLRQSPLLGYYSLLGRGWLGLVTRYTWGMGFTYVFVWRTL